MEKPGIGFHDELAKTLLVWLQDPGLAGESALKALQGQIAAGERASENLVILLLKGKNQAAIPSVNTLWLGDPLTWEHHYAEFGPVIEPSVLEHLNSEKAPLRRSAINLLGRTGTDASLPPLGQLAGSLDPEIRVLAERAIKAIKER
jgi:HEAT repeat protein